MLTRRLWLRRSAMGPRTLPSKQTPRWYSCCWSIGKHMVGGRGVSELDACQVSVCEGRVSQRQQNPCNLIHFSYKTFPHSPFPSLHACFIHAPRGWSPLPQPGLIKICSCHPRNSWVSAPYCLPPEMETTLPALLAGHGLPRLFCCWFLQRK